MKRLFTQPFTLLIHIALAIIVAGAFVTHFCGIQGTLTLGEGDAPATRFDKTSGPGDGTLPFGVSLVRTEIICYPGTTAPMDFRSVLCIGEREITVAMNAVAEIDSWRFYQSGMGDGSSILSVSHDPWGIGITYTGYLLLGIGMLGFFFQRKSLWRSPVRLHKKTQHGGKPAMLRFALYFVVHCFPADSRRCSAPSHAISARCTSIGTTAWSLCAPWRSTSPKSSTAQPLTAA